MRSAFKIMGIINWEKLHSHVFCSVFIAKSENDSKVNITKTMAASRHTSASASVVYQKSGAISKYNQIDALLQNYEPIKNILLDRKIPPLPKPTSKEEEVTYPTTLHTLFKSSS